MDRINFCEPTLWGRFERLHLPVLCALLAAVLAATDCLRLWTALQHVRDVETRRDALAARVRLRSEHAKLLEARRALLFSALGYRRSNAGLAKEIARVGDALGGEIALTVLRSHAGGVEVEGRGRSIGDVRKALQRIHDDGSREIMFEIRRDDTSQSWVAFRIGFIGAAPLANE